MPDVEVKLNIEAEYKQALVAIANMGKALEAVHAKAKILQEATMSVAQSGKSGSDDDAKKALDGLNKASSELSASLARVAVAGEKARQVIAALSQVEPLNAEAAALLAKAANGYERLATMAQMAANAAERFKKVSSAGLTTEEMLRQAQAAEKQIETLRKQAEQLGNSIVQQQKQLTILRETYAEEQKLLHVRKERQKESEKSIEQLDREAKAEEESRYKMELAGKTKLELVKIIKELNAQMKEASVAGDKEAYEKFARQATLANQALRRLNMSARVANIAFMQQAQTASRISSNLNTLTSGFANLSDAAAKGELNLTGMASSMMDLWYTMKAGMGPIGWAMLALDGLQKMLNNTAKSRQEIARLQEDNKRALNDEAAAYEALEKAIKNANDQEALKSAISEVEQQYEQINTALERSVQLINDALAAEKTKSAVLQGEQKHIVELQKLELKRKLTSGEISKSEYNRALIDIDSATAIRNAEEGVKTAKAEKEAADKRVKTLKEAKDKAFSYSDSYRINAAFYDQAPETVKTMMAERAKLVANLESAQETRRGKVEAIKRDKSAWEMGAEGLEGLIAFTQHGTGMAGFADKFGVKITTAMERRGNELAKANRNVNKRKQELAEFDKKMKKLLRGKDFDTYLAEQARVKAQADKYAEKFKEVEAQYKAAQEAAATAAKNSKQAESDLATITRQQNELNTAKKKNLEAEENEERKKQEDAKTAARLRRKYQEQVKDLRNVSIKNIEQMKTKAKQEKGRIDGEKSHAAVDWYIERLDAELESRNSKVINTKQAAFAEARSKGRGAKLLDGIDYGKISGVLNDFVISPEEAKFIKNQLNLAIKAGNATTAEFISSILTLAMGYKEYQGEMFDTLNRMKSKAAAAAQKNKTQIRNLYR